jgi:hypothetical protein
MITIRFWWAGLCEERITGKMFGQKRQIG